MTAIYSDTFAVSNLPTEFQLTFSLLMATFKLIYVNLYMTYYIHKINNLGFNIKAVLHIKVIFITTKTFSIQSLLGTIDRLGCQAQIGQSWQG